MQEKAKETIADSLVAIHHRCCQCEGCVLNCLGQLFHRDAGFIQCLITCLMLEREVQGEQWDVSGLLELKAAIDDGR